MAKGEPHFHLQSLRRTEQARRSLGRSPKRLRQIVTMRFPPSAATSDERLEERRYDESVTLASRRRVASVDQCSQPVAAPEVLQTDRHAVAKSFMLMTAAQHKHFATARVWQHERTACSTDSMIVQRQNKTVMPVLVVWTPPPPQHFPCP